MDHIIYNFVFIVFMVLLIWGIRFFIRIQPADGMFIWSKIEKNFSSANVPDEISPDIVKISSKMFPRVNNENADHYFYYSRDLIYRFRVTPTPGWEYLTPSVYEITGFTREEHYMDSSIVFNTIHPDDRQILIDKISNRVDYSKPIIQRWFKKDGSLIWLEEYCSPIYDSKGFLVAFEGVCRNITERVIDDSTRKNSIINDPLTGLLNRAYFEQALSEIDRDEPIGIIVIGIDDLRSVNFGPGGYTLGNKMITSLAEVLKNSYINNSILARTGSGEFALLLRDLSKNSPELVSRSILKSILDLNFGARENVIHASIGFSSTSELNPMPFDVFLDADRNMYNNKTHKK